MFNVIVKIAAGAALAAASNYAGKAVAEKFYRENGETLKKGKEKRKACELKNLLVDVYDAGIETEAHKKTLNFHKDGEKDSIQCATAMVVVVGEIPKISYYQTRIVSEETELFIDGRHMATFKSVDFVGILKEQISSHYFVEAYNI
jgi:hypothetical protein